MEKTLICAVCGKEYKACPNCYGVESYTPWRQIVDTSEHWKLFILLSDYSNGKIKKAEAKKMLPKIDYSGYEAWDTASRKVIEELIGTTINKEETPSDETEETVKSTPKTRVRKAR